MSMKEALAEQKAKVQARLGEKFDVIAGEVERIRGLGLPDHSLKVGQSAPGFALPDAYGREVSLKKLLAQGPVVVSFYRGEW
jgi:AhpC/TSA family